MKYWRDEKGRFSTGGGGKISNPKIAGVRYAVRVTEYQDRPAPTLKAIRAWKKTGRPKTGTRRRVPAKGVRALISNEFSIPQWPRRHGSQKRVIK